MNTNRVKMKWILSKFNDGLIINKQFRNTMNLKKNRKGFINIIEFFNNYNYPYSIDIIRDKTGRIKICNKRDIYMLLYLILILKNEVDDLDLFLDKKEENSFFYHAKENYFNINIYKSEEEYKKFKSFEKCLEKYKEK